MKLYLHSIGCRLNQSEIETLGRQLAASGHEIVADSQTADTVVVNTCAVTAEAARDARSLTRRIHRQDSDTEVVLTGCYATIAPDELAVLPGVARVVDNRDKDRLVTLLDPTASSDDPIFDLEPVQRAVVPGAMGRTRGFIKVQDGCDNRCTFCVTTVARGEGRSRHLGDIVAEIQGFGAAGYQEVVLTGVHLGSYGRDLESDVALGDLVRAILHHTDIPRLRLSSLEPWDIEPDFFALWENPRLLPHLHMPLQSGSDAILRRMARRTSRAAFREMAAAARAAIPDLNLSTDLIAGFPGETDDDSAATLAYVEELAFSRLHVFTYSQRPGTAAARFPGQLPGPVRKERARALIALGESLSLSFHHQHDGQTRPVLWETATGAGPGGLRWAGYTDNYIRVTAEGPPELLNTVTAARLDDPQPDGMGGTVLPDA